MKPFKAGDRVKWVQPTDGLVLGGIVIDDERDYINIETAPYKRRYCFDRTAESIERFQLVHTDEVIQVRTEDPETAALKAAVRSHNKTCKASARN